MKRVKVDIMGHEYVLRVAVGESQVRRTAAYLNERLNEVLSTTTTSTTLSATVLAALNITNELLLLQDSRDNLLQEIEAQTDKMLRKMERLEG